MMMSPTHREPGWQDNIDVFFATAAPE